MNSITQNSYYQLPLGLTDHALFCCWRLESDGERETKRPYNPNYPTTMAKSNDPSTFADFTTAITATEQYQMSGIGLLVGNGICGIDIDHCITDGKLNDTASAVIAQFPSYAEYSPSKTGLHLYFVSDGFIYDKERWCIKNPNNGIEVYISGATNRFLTVTGDHIPDTPNDVIHISNEQLTDFLDQWMLKPQSSGAADLSRSFKQRTSVHRSEPTAHLSEKDWGILSKAQNAKNKDKFNKLWNGHIDDRESHSEADLALCSELAYWTQGDINQMDRLFRNSELMRDKWDEYRGGNTTYGELTLQKAISSFERRRDTIMDEKNTEQIQKLKDMGALNRIGNDADNASLFADFYNDRIIYIRERGCWFVYNGKYWEHDIGKLKVMEFCKELAELLLDIAQETSDWDPEQKARIWKNAAKWKERSTRERILNDAAGLRIVSSSDLDANPYLLNCSNCTLDLLTMEHRAHDPSDFLTECTSAAYDPEATYETWRLIQEEGFYEPLCVLAANDMYRRRNDSVLYR